MIATKSSPESVYLFWSVYSNSRSRSALKSVQDWGPIEVRELGFKMKVNHLNSGTRKQCGRLKNNMIVTE